MTRHEQDLLIAIVDGALYFVDKALQAKIDAAVSGVDRRENPQSIGDRIMKTCWSEIKRMARLRAQCAFYAEPGERVMHGIVTE